MLDHLAIESCGCRTDRKTGLTTHYCDEHQRMAKRRQPQLNLPYSLRLIVGSEYTGIDFDDRLDDVLVGSEIEPIELAEYRDGRDLVRLYLVVQDGPMLIEHRRQCQEPNSNTSTWLSRNYTAYRLLRADKVFQNQESE